MRIGIYPGTFDPITLGHIDVIKKSLKLVDKVIVATTYNVNKDYFFTIDERIEIIKKSLLPSVLFFDLLKTLHAYRVTQMCDLSVHVCTRLHLYLCI